MTVISHSVSNSLKMRHYRVIKTSNSLLLITFSAVVSSIIFQFLHQLRLLINLLQQLCLSFIKLVQALVH